MFFGRDARAHWRIPVVAAGLMISAHALAADPPGMEPPVRHLMTVNCNASGYNSYTLQRGDTCLSLAGNPRFHFETPRQVEQINKPLSGFRCANARQGQIICYPRQ